MPRQMIINLPVKNTEQSKEFFTKVGLSFNAEMSDENATCFDVAENIVVALLPEAHFNEIAGNDAGRANAAETLLAIGANDRQEVDSLVENVVAAGGTELHEPQEAGSLYGRSFEDIDHHKWNVYHVADNES